MRFFILFVLLFIFISLASILIYGLYSQFFPNKFACRVFGWHKPTNQIGYDGCSSTSVCVCCDKNIIQDSQGNWF